MGKTADKIAGLRVKTTVTLVVAICSESPCACPGGVARAVWVKRTHGAQV